MLLCGRPELLLFVSCVCSMARDIFRRANSWLRVVIEQARGRGVWGVFKHGCLSLSSKASVLLVMIVVQRRLLLLRLSVKSLMR